VYGNFDNLNFYSACRKPDVTLLEYPIFEDKLKRSWQKGLSKDMQLPPGPIRVVSSTDHNKFCGVMTHVTEDGKGRGTGGFRVCEKF